MIISVSGSSGENVKHLELELRQSFKVLWLGKRAVKLMEDTCGGFFDCAGTPRMGGTSVWGADSRSRSGKIAVMSAADDTDANAMEDSPQTIINIDNRAAAKESEILGLSSPDSQALPTRTTSWSGRESFWGKERDVPSRFFPDDRDACSDSSPACAENEDDGDGGNESSESESVLTELDQSEIGISATEEFGDAVTHDECCGDIVASLGGQSLTLENSANTVQQMQEAGSPAIDDDTQNLHIPQVLPAEGFVAVRERLGVVVVREPDTGAGAVVNKVPQWSIGYKTAVVLAALTTFVLGMIVGGAVYGHLVAAAFRVPSTAVTPYVHPTIDDTAEPNPVVDESVLGLDAGGDTRYLGRTAAASAFAPVGTLTSQTSPFGGLAPAKTTTATATETKAVGVNVDEIDAHIQAVKRMRIAREVIEEVQDAWIEVTSSAAPGDRIPGLLDGPGPGAPSNVVDAHGPPPTATIALHAPVGWFAKSLDRLTRGYKPGFEGLMNGPWV
eukprot:g5859.t1